VIDRVEYHEIEVSLRRPFVTAAAAVRTRRSILVALHGDGTTGWGEAAPFPGAGVDGIDGVWDALSSGEAERSALAAAAWGEAAADLAARRAGEPLWRRLGGSGSPLVASLAIGMTEDPVAAAAEAVAAGYRRVKLKVAPGRDLSTVAAVRAAFPDLEVGLDANGGYTPSVDDVPGELADLGVAYLEQPYPVGAEAETATLRRRLPIPIGLDESVTSPAAAAQIVERGAADVLVVKPGRLGLDGSLAVHALAVDAGLHTKASGLLETAVGRAHTAALATLPSMAFSDLARGMDVFAVDPGGAAAPLVDGTLRPADRPGIGIEPDLGLVEVIRSAARAVR